MVLRGDIGPAGGKIPNGLISAPVAIFQLDGVSAKGQSCQLMSETDAEDRLSADQFSKLRDAGSVFFRISGTVGQHDTVGTGGENLLCLCERRPDGYGAAALLQTADDVVLCTVVNQRYLTACFALGRPETFFVSGDGSHGVFNPESTDGTEIRRNFVANHGVHHAFFPGDANDLPCIHTAQTGNTFCNQVIIQRIGAAKIGGRIAQISYYISEQCA